MAFYFFMKHSTVLQHTDFNSMADDAMEIHTSDSLKTWAFDLTSRCRGEQVDATLFGFLLEVFHKGLSQESNFRSIETSGEQRLNLDVKQNVTYYITKCKRISERVLYEGGCARTVDHMHCRINDVKKCIESIFEWYATNDIRVTEEG